MKKNSKLVSNITLHKGVVYRYYLISQPDKCYVGETMDEEKRKKDWKNPNNPYGGGKIKDARNLYGVSSFSREVLVKITDTDKRVLEKRLEKLESEYIEKYDSFYNGFNGNKGGKGRSGCTISQQELYHRKVTCGVDTRVIFANGTTKEYLTMTDAAKDCGVVVSTVFNCIRKGTTTRNGIRFEAA